MTIEQFSQKIVKVAVFFLVGMVFIAQLFMPPEYSWLRNTISELAAQRLPTQWVMQAGFAGFGLLMAVGLGLAMLRKGRVRISQLLVLVWGLSFIPVAIFSDEPFLAGVPVNWQEGQLHSLFAQVGGWGLSLGMLAAVFEAASGRERGLHLAFLVLLTGVSALFGLAENGVLALGVGLMQRLLWLVGLSWLLLSQRAAGSGKQQTGSKRLQ